MLKKLLMLCFAFMLSIGAAFATVDVNTADQAVLESVKGLGPVKSKAIIDERTKKGCRRPRESRQGPGCQVGDEFGAERPDDRRFIAAADWQARETHDHARRQRRAELDREILDGGHRRDLARGHHGADAGRDTRLGHGGIEEVEEGKRCCKCNECGKRICPVRRKQREVGQIEAQQERQGRPRCGCQSVTLRGPRRREVAFV